MRSRASIAASNRSAVGFVDVFFHCRWNTGRAGGRFHFRASDQEPDGLSRGCVYVEAGRGRLPQRSPLAGRERLNAALVHDQEVLGCSSEGCGASNGARAVHSVHGWVDLGSNQLECTEHFCCCPRIPGLERRARDVEERCHHEHALLRVTQ